MKHYLALFLVIIASAQITPLAINTPFSTTLYSTIPNYFSLSLDSSVTDGYSLLFLTVITEDDSDIYIFVSTTDSDDLMYPDENSYITECTHQSVDTCVIQLSAKNVYFSVVASANTAASILAELRNTFYIFNDKKYRVDFQYSQSVLVGLYGNQTKDGQKTLISATYNTSGSSGRFSLIAAADVLPNNDVPIFESNDIGAFSQLLQLPSIPDTSVYYIVIEAQLGVKIDFTVHSLNPDAPLPFNSTVMYHATTDTVYTFQNSWGKLDKSLFLNVYSYDGFASFTVNYCEGMLKIDFQNYNQENEEIVITFEERKACYDALSTKYKIVPKETVTVSIFQLVFSLSYQLNLNEGAYTYPLRAGQTQFGVLGDSESRRYEIVQEEGVETILQFQQIGEDGELIFKVVCCKNTLLHLNDTCDQIWSSQDSQDTELIQMNFTTVPKKSYFVVVSGTAQYEITFVPAVMVIPLVKGKVVKQVVERNQYTFFMVDLTGLKNGTAVTIHTTDISGSTAILTSTKVENPTFDKARDNYQDITPFWTGRTNQFIVDGSIDVIWVSVMGKSQSMFTIQAEIDEGRDVPSRYRQLIENGDNSFIIPSPYLVQKQYILLSFSSHAVPYSIVFSPMPECIAFGYSLPINQSCTTPPRLFTSKTVYFNISRNVTPQVFTAFRFQAYVNCGQYRLTQVPLLIACQEECYEIVKVHLEDSPVDVVHSGRGGLSLLSDPSQYISRGYLTVVCPETYPCEVSLNASLSYEGQMVLSMQAEMNQITWQTKPIPLRSIQTEPLHLFYMSPTMNFILNSKAATFIVYCSVAVLNQREGNIMDVVYPNETSYDLVMRGNPLRNSLVVQLSDELLRNKSCLDEGVVCYATVSVYLDESVIYSEEYIAEGVGYYSSNTESYILSGWVLDMDESFSLVVFNDEDEESARLLSVKPMSNCLPLIYVGEGSVQPTYMEPEYNMVELALDVTRFSVLTEEQCRYKVVLSPSLDWFPIVIGYEETVKVSNGSIIFYLPPAYLSEDNIKITVNGKIKGIYVKHGGDNAQKQADSLYSTNSNTLIVPSPASYYTILVKTVSTVKEISILAAALIPALPTSSSIILRVHRQSSVRLSDPYQFASFKIYSTSVIRVYVFLKGSSASVKMVISSGYYEPKVLSERIVSQSDTDGYIEISWDGSEYEIEVSKLSEGDVEFGVYFEEVGEDRRLFPGIIMYDTLAAGNCYEYVSEMMVGRADLVLDIVFPNIENVKIGSDVSNNSLLYSAVIDGPPIKSMLSRITASSLTFRLTATYVPDQVYTICFYSGNDTAIPTASDYYLMLRDVAMPFIPVGYEETFLGGDYETYELVEPTVSNSIMVEMKSCSQTLNSSNVMLTGSSSYSGILRGKYTELTDLQRGGSSVTARISVEAGYYYLGVRQINLKSAYSIRTVFLSANESLLAADWYLQDNNIQKIDMKDEYVDVELAAVKAGKSWESNEEGNITYVIFVMEAMKRGMRKDEAQTATLSLSARMKCPKLISIKEDYLQYENSSILTYTKAVTFSSTQAYIESKAKTIKFRIVASELPKLFNLTASAIVQRGAQSTRFYYSEMQVENKLQNGSYIVLVAVAVMLAIAALILGGFFGYKRFLKWKASKNVDFEMSNIEKEIGDKKDSRVVMNKQPNYKDLIQEA